MTKKKKDKRTNNDLQNITQKTKDRATRTPLKHFWFDSLNFVFRDLGLFVIGHRKRICDSVLL
jgi:hypothetical protein